MIKCRQFFEQLGDYLDGDAGAALRSDVERHIGHCHDCWVVVDGCKKTISIYQSQELRAIPAELHDRLMQALEARCRGSKKPAEPESEP